VKADDGDYLRYIVRSLDYVFEDTAAGRDHFVNDRRTSAAVLYRLQTLADALGELSAERRRRYPGVPFRAIKGFRNVLVHDYIGLQLDSVWTVIEEHLPPLKPQVVRMLADLSTEASPS
jgi:uncharacterized protein with HEPN domain